MRTLRARRSTFYDKRLVSLIDLGLTLKHIHWNVVGPREVARDSYVHP